MIEYVFLGLLVVFFLAGIYVLLTGLRALLRSRRDIRVHDGSPFYGWAKVSLLGRTELVGAAREVRDGEQSYLEVLTVDGRAIRTQYSAIYSIERVPFGRIETAVERAEQDARRHAEHDNDLNAQKNRRLVALRDALDDAHGHAEDYFEDGEHAQAADVHLKACRDVLTKAIEADDELNRLPF